jgi:hypothetical protein
VAMHDQIENLRNAILKKKARLAEIESTLSRPATPIKTRWGWGKPTPGSRSRLQEDRLRLQHAIAEQEVTLGRLMAPQEKAQMEEHSQPLSTGASIERFRSPWKHALAEALTACGKRATYQDIANWVAEHHPYVLPSYCKGDSLCPDLGLTVRHNKKIRDQFQKDVSKVKHEMLP